MVLIVKYNKFSRISMMGCNGPNESMLKYKHIMQGYMCVLLAKWCSIISKVT